jgi:hypothetical protein
MRRCGVSSARGGGAESMTGKSLPSIQPFSRRCRPTTRGSSGDSMSVTSAGEAGAMQTHSGTPRPPATKIRFETIPRLLLPISSPFCGRELPFVERLVPQKDMFFGEFPEQVRPEPRAIASSESGTSIAVSRRKASGRWWPHVVWPVSRRTTCDCFNDAGNSYALRRPD